MAASRHAAETASVDSQKDLTSLRFNQPISWRAGKPIATAELLKRLKALAVELRDMDQEDANKSSLEGVANELVAPNLLAHKDNGVKAHVACCLVDILRICAPDAPYTGTQIKDIFIFIVNIIIPALSDPTHTYHLQHKYVLESLADVKSIVLITDLPNSEQLLARLFRNIFDVLSSASPNPHDEQLSKSAQHHLSVILVTLVDEATSLDTSTMDAILAQFQRVARKKGEAEEKQLTLLPKELPEAYKTAARICNECSDKMARNISQYFSEVMVTNLSGQRREGDEADVDEDDVPAAPSDSDMRELRSAHLLLRELWRSAPIVLQNVVPLVETEISAENVQLRLLATETLGDMISGIGTAGLPSPPVLDPAAYPPFTLDATVSDTESSILTTPKAPKPFAEAHNSAYRSFISRQNDRSPAIRAAWTRAVGRVLTSSAGGVGISTTDQNILVRGITNMLNDGEEKVRLSAIRAIGAFGLHDIVTILAPYGNVTRTGSALCNLADRCRDVKPAVRAEAMSSLGRLWGVASGEIDLGNRSVIAAVGGIPSRIMDTFYANDPSINTLLDQVLYNQLIPLTYPPLKGKSKQSSQGRQPDQVRVDAAADELRTGRILLFLKSLDARPKKAFFAMQARQAYYKTFLGAFIKRCELYNGGVTKEASKDAKVKLEDAIKYILPHLPEAAKASIDLHNFAKANNRQVYKLLGRCMSPNTDFADVQAAMNKVVVTFTKSHAALLETLFPIMYRSAYLIYNRSHLPYILQYARNDADRLGSIAHELLSEISEKDPEIFEASVKELCKTLEDQAPKETRPNLVGSVETLKACANYARHGKQKLPSDPKFISALQAFARLGKPPTAAKHAVTILIAASNKKEMHARDLLKDSVTGWAFDAENSLTKLATISQLSHLTPNIADEFKDDILELAANGILHHQRTSGDDVDVGDHEETSATKLDLDSECEAKCWSVKILVNGLRATENSEQAKSAAAQVFELLNILISRKGELLEENRTPKQHKSRLYLLAAQSMLKLCTRDVFEKLLAPSAFEQLALVAQSDLAVVRQCFLQKVQKYLIKEKLTPRFYTIFFLTAFEPRPSFRHSIETWIRSRAKLFQDQRSRLLESTLPRLISLLAHHPDYAEDLDAIADQTRYIAHYLSCVATQDNCGMLYKYAERVKQAADAVDPSASEHLYILSELTQTAIRKWEEMMGWSMQTWPAKVLVPVGIFGPLPNHEAAQDIAEKQYLSNEADSVIERVILDQDKKKKRKSVDNGSANASKKLKSEHKGKLNSNRVKAATTTKILKTRAPKQVSTPARKRSNGYGDSDSSEDNTKSRKVSNLEHSEIANRRQSGRRASTLKNYQQGDSSEDDAKMLEGVSRWQYTDENGDSREPLPEEDALSVNKGTRNRSVPGRQDSANPLESEEEERTPKSSNATSEGEHGPETTPIRREPRLADSTPNDRRPQHRRIENSRISGKVSSSSKAKKPLVESNRAGPRGKAFAGGRKAKAKGKAQASTNVCEMELSD